MKNNSLDFIINGNVFEFKKLKWLRDWGLNEPYDLDYPSEKYVKIFKKYAKYFKNLGKSISLSDNCSHKYEYAYLIECYETENVDFFPIEEKQKAIESIKSDEYVANTCDFTLILCPDCGDWYGYYMYGEGVFYDEEFGEVRLKNNLDIY